MNLILVGEREPTTGLWTLPISAHTKPQQKVDAYDLQLLSDATKQQQFAANAYTITTRQNAINFLHQSLFSPLNQPSFKQLTITT